MSVQAMAEYDAILKDYYVGPITEQINYQSILLDKIERDSSKVDHTGRRAIYPLHVGGNESHKFLKDPIKGANPATKDLLLPEGDPQKFEDAIYGLSYNSWAIEISDPTVQASERNEGAFTSAVDAETKFLVKDAKKKMNTLAFGGDPGFPGLMEFADATGAVGGLDPATVPVWAGNEADKNNADATELDYGLINDAIGERTEQRPDIWLTERGVRRMLSVQYQSNKQFNDAQATKVHGGYTAIFVDDIPVLVDDSCPKKTAFAITFDALKWAEQGPPGWLQKADASVWHLKVATDDGNQGRREAIWQAYWRWYCSLVCVERAALGKITGIKNAPTAAP
jgi:hypothetical protein